MAYRIRLPGTVFPSLLIVAILLIRVQNFNGGAQCSSGDVWGFQAQVTAFMESADFVLKYMPFGQLDYFPMFSQAHPRCRGYARYAGCQLVEPAHGRQWCTQCARQGLLWHMRSSTRPFFSSMISSSPSGTHL